MSFKVSVRFPLLNAEWLTRVLYLPTTSGGVR